MVHESLVGTYFGIESADRIDFSDGGALHAVEEFSAIGETAYRLVTTMCLIDDAVGEVLQFGMYSKEVCIVLCKILGRSNIYYLSVGIVKFEGHMQLCDGFEFIGP